MSIRMTHANGVNVREFDHLPSNPARRFAASLEQSSPAVEWVKTLFSSGTVSVRLATDVDECESLPTPEGWEVTNMNVTTGGCTFVHYREVHE